MGQGQFCFLSRAILDTQGYVLHTFSVFFRARRETQVSVVWPGIMGDERGGSSGSGYGPYFTSWTL